MDLQHRGRAACYLIEGAPKCKSISIGGAELVGPKTYTGSKEAHRSAVISRDVPKRGAPGTNELLLVDHDVVGDCSPLRHVGVGEGARGLENQRAHWAAQCQGQLNAGTGPTSLHAHIESLRQAPRTRGQSLPQS